jgi:hypothetical protein
MRPPFFNAAAHQSQLLLDATSARLPPPQQPHLPLFAADLPLAASIPVPLPPARPITPYFEQYQKFVRDSHVHQFNMVFICTVIISAWSVIYNRGGFFTLNSAINLNFRRNHRDT